MYKRKVILRADAGKTIGFGHFIRSLALAGYLKDKYDCYFCTFNPTDLHISEYQLAEIEKVCSYIDIKAGTYDEYNANFLTALKGDEIVVLDNYYFSTDYQKRIRSLGCRLVCIDDMHDRHFVADALITGCPIEKSEFSMEHYTLFCSGIKHSFLRPPFLSAAKSVIHRTRQIKNIVIAIGGADPYGLTNRILQLLSEIDANLRISVIAGDTVSINQQLAKNTDIYRRVGAEEIVKIFSQSDLGLFSASTICVEALACSLPVAAGWYVDNQKEFYEYGVENSLFTPLGNFLGPKDALKANIEYALKNATTTAVPRIDFSDGKKDIIEIFRQL